MANSSLSDWFMAIWRSIPQGIPDPTLEYYFASKAVGPFNIRKQLKVLGWRNWHFDLAWPEQKVAVELEGGTWSQGRHTRGKGYAEDCVKYNVAVELGWRVLRYTRDQIEDQPWHMLAQIRRVVEQERSHGRK